METQTKHASKLLMPIILSALVLAVFAFAVPMAAQAATTTFSGTVSANCNATKTLLSSTIRGGDTLKLDSITGNICTRVGAGGPKCANNLRYGCEDEHKHSCTDGSTVIGFFNASNQLLMRAQVNSALSALTAPAGTMFAYIYVPDVKNYYYDNNAAYKCTFTGTVNSVPACSPHASQKCVGNSVYWFDSCNVQQELAQTCSGNQTCSNGTCVNQNVTCNSNSDCGANKFIDGTFCMNGNVYKNYQINTCSNPGTSQSSCSMSTVPVAWYNCTGGQTCSNGLCREASFTCNCDADCGGNGFVDGTFCQYGDVYKNYRMNTCNNPGTSQSSCSVSSVPVLWYNCGNGQTCSNGYCFGGCGS